MKYTTTPCYNRPLHGQQLCLGPVVNSGAIAVLASTLVAQSPKAKASTGDTMQVSFVIPAHNAGATLAETVESLQAQTDDTLAVAARDARLRVITQPQVGFDGVGASGNS